MTEEERISTPTTSNEYCKRYADVVCALQAASSGALEQVLLYEELIALCREWQAAVAADLASAEEGSAEFVAGEAAAGTSLAARLERCRIGSQALSCAISQTVDMAVAKRAETISGLRIGAPAA